MILLSGGSGQVGTALRALRADIVAPSRDQLDLSQPTDMIATVTDLRPDAIINCAAYTAVDAAEDDPDTAIAINATSVGLLAEYAADRGIPFATYSTDYVFSGTATSPYVESSPTSPINTYGRSKAMGEVAALSAYPGALVVRTSWVISATHRSFVTNLLTRAATQQVHVVTDQTGCPTFAPDLAAATLETLEAGVTGLLHLTNAGATTWFELARTACREAGIDPGRVAATTTASFPRPARRPAYSVLGSERLSDLALSPMPGWRDAVKRLVRGLP